MKRFALTLLPTLAAASAFAQASTEKVNLTYVPPAAMISTLRETGTRQAELQLLEGISRLEPDEKNNSLNITGKPEAIARLKKLIVLLDVQPRPVLVRLKLVRVIVGAAGPGSEEVLQKPVISTVNNRAASLEIKNESKAGERTDQFTVRIVPHINGDNTVTLSANSFLLTPGVKNQPQRLNAQAIRRVKQNKEVRLYGFSDSPHQQVQDALRQGKLANLPGVPNTAYFIDATVAEVKNTAGMPQP